MIGVLPQCTTPRIPRYIERQGTKAIMQALSPVAKRIMAEPQVPMKDDNIADLMEIWNSAQELGIQQNLVEIAGTYIDMRTWNNRMATLDHTSGCTSSLEKVSLSFGWTALEDDIGLVSDLQKLKSLHISLQSGVYSRRSPIFFDKKFLQSGSWQYLRHLSLAHIALSQTTLQNLLQRLGSTLRSLELAAISFRNISFTNSALPAASLISLAEFFHFLHDSMSLTHARFSLSIQDKQTYVITSYPKSIGKEVELAPAERKRHRHLLRYRIEDYVTRTGECPFTSVDCMIPQEDGTCVKEIEWIWPPCDETWLMHNDTRIWKRLGITPTQLYDGDH
ncbi:hypothetical protein B0J14DRAFT_97485 [Halenospora varia]|nr:hypothetical protein B0J14DRAFT_97485 [Halenospora varia]